VDNDYDALLHRPPASRGAFPRAAPPHEPHPCFMVSPHGGATLLLQQAG
jgi:hypothetical protein